MKSERTESATTTATTAPAPSIPSGIAQPFIPSNFNFPMGTAGSYSLYAPPQGMMAGFGMLPSMFSFPGALPFPLNTTPVRH